MASSAAEETSSSSEVPNAATTAGNFITREEVAEALQRQAARGDWRALPPEDWLRLHAIFSASRRGGSRSGSKEMPLGHLDVARSNILLKPLEVIPGAIARTVGNLAGGASLGLAGRRRKGVVLKSLQGWLSHMALRQRCLAHGAV